MYNIRIWMGKLYELKQSYVFPKFEASELVEKYFCDVYQE